MGDGTAPALWGLCCVGLECEKGQTRKDRLGITLVPTAYELSSSLQASGSGADPDVLWLPLEKGWRNRILPRERPPVVTL